MIHQWYASGTRVTEVTKLNPEFRSDNVSNQNQILQHLIYISDVHYSIELVFLLQYILVTHSIQLICI